MSFKHETDDCKSFKISIVSCLSFSEGPIFCIDVFHVNMNHLHLHIIPVEKKEIENFAGLDRLKTILIDDIKDNHSTKSYGFPSIVCSECVSFTAPNLNAIFHRKYFSHFRFESVNGPPLIFGHPRWYFGFFWLSKHRLNGCFRSAPIVH